VLNVHCRECGRLELQRISREYVQGGFAWFWRMLGASAYCCEPCRNKFFSFLPVRRDRPVEIGADK